MNRRAITMPIQCEENTSFYRARWISGWKTLGINENKHIFYNIINNKRMLRPERLSIGWDGLLFVLVCDSPYIIVVARSGFIVRPRFMAATQSWRGYGLWISSNFSLWLFTQHFRLSVLLDWHHASGRVICFAAKAQQCCTARFRLCVVAIAPTRVE